MQIDMPADLAKDSTQDLEPDMVKPGAPVRIDAPATFSVSLGSPRELVANVVDEQGIPISGLEVTYTKTTSGVFNVNGKRIEGTEVGEGKLELSAQGVPSVTVDIQVIETKMLELPPTIYLNVDQELTLMDLSSNSIAQDERKLLKFAVEEDDPIAKIIIDNNSIRGLERGETKLTATLLHLSQEIRVVVRKPIDQLLISPPHAAPAHQ